LQLGEDPVQQRPDRRRSQFRLAFARHAPRIHDPAYTRRMETRPGWRAALRAALLADGEAEGVLRGIGRQLGLPKEPDGPGLNDVAIARALIAIGPALFEAGYDQPNLRATLRAAAAFVATPSDETHGELIEVATMSYPFGPGDGCLSMGRHGEEEAD